MSKEAKLSDKCEMFLGNCQQITDETVHNMVCHQMEDLASATSLGWHNERKASVNVLTPDQRCFSILVLPKRIMKKTPEGSELWTLCEDMLFTGLEVVGTTTVLFFVREHSTISDAELFASQLESLLGEPD